MKHDLFSWKEVKPNEKHQIKGRLQLRLSAPAPLYVAALGAESLVGIAATFDVHFAEAVEWYIDGTARVFLFVPEPTVTEGDREQYTNIDRMVDDNPALAAVTQALRLLAFERRNMLAEVRAIAAANAPPAPSAPPSDEVTE